MKQTDSAIRTAESEVQALASTEAPAEYIRILRESLCLPTSVVRENAIIEQQSYWRLVKDRGEQSQQQMKCIKSRRKWRMV